MKKIYLAILPIALFFAGGVFAASAQDLIILRNGNIIEAKVTEISPTEIRYKRANHLDGPTVIVPVRDVLSIRYENGMTEVMNPGAGAATAAGAAGWDNPAAVDARITPLQFALNILPPVPIFGSNLKFEFSGNTWTARVNGENFSAGTIVFETTDNGAILTLQQTHIWPGTVGRTAGRVARRIPGGATAGRALNTAGNIAGAAGAVETSGTEIILEYKAGPPATLSLRSYKDTTQDTAQESVPAVNPDNPSFGISANPLGILSGGPSICLEFTKGNFYSEIHLIYSGDIWFYDFFLGSGVLVTFNRFWHSRNGGGYLGGGIGYGYRYSSLPIGLNGGYKFITSSGFYTRIGVFVGYNFGSLWDRGSPVSIKPELAFGWTIR